MFLSWLLGVWQVGPVLDPSSAEAAESGAKLVSFGPRQSEAGVGKRKVSVRTRLMFCAEKQPHSLLETEPSAEPSLAMHWEPGQWYIRVTKTTSLSPLRRATVDCESACLPQASLQSNRRDCR
ncbi:unnamed protein product [Protopolystoma xenopodis]|uniref:Uncharacterized protein n=1 Tax=Protopolystoma xenopodis TaxID=117903 RepID=A0A3S4ZY67_9PLAT|nr:unnamed protein product [Protopolystoma xenopodis]